MNIYTMTLDELNAALAETEAEGGRYTAHWWKLMDEISFREEQSMGDITRYDANA